MTFLAQYPINESLVNPYIGRQVGAVTPDGEVICGIIECIHKGNLVLRPLGNVPETVIQSIRQKMKADPKIGSALVKSKRKMKPMTIKNKARIKAFGGYGYPYGWGYGNWGWGAGWWWIWPLFALTALVALPFFFI